MPDVTIPRRSLGPWRSWAFVVGGTIGSAIFMMPAVLVPYGGLGLLSWAAAAAGALCVASTFASLARRVSTTGGPYSYAHAAFGDLGGFVVAWLYWIALWTACAAITTGFTAYLGALIPAVKASPVLSLGAGLMLVWSLIGVNVAGVRQSGILGLVTTLLKLTPLVVIAVAGLFFVDRDILPPMNPGTGSPLLLFASAFTLTFWTFGGLESITVPSEDVIEPSRTIPRALLLGTSTVAVIYLLVAFVVSGVVPAAELKASSSPLADAGVRLGGYWAGLAVTLGALASTLGCLNANILAVSQAAMAAARDGVFPHLLARLTSRHTPGRSLVVTGMLISAMLVMNYTKGMVGAFTFLLLLSALALVVPYAFSALAALVLEARQPEPNRWRRGREAVVAVLAFGVCIWVIAAAGQETVYWGFLLLMAGLPVYVLMTRRRERLATAAIAAAVLLGGCGPRGAAPSVVLPPQWLATHRANVAIAESAMVVTAAPLATNVGVAVLRSGGNAVDAAVSVAFALAVVHPTAGNIGGGGFIVARMGKESAALDFRESAPGAASRDMYLDTTGAVTNRSLVGALAAGVPGSVAGLWAAHQRFGRKPWRELVQPAIDLAEGGFTVDSAFAGGVAGRTARLKRFPASARLFLPNGEVIAVGETWRNPELASTLRRIAEHGREGFYAGATADLVVAEMQRSGGVISLADLQRYEAKWREPVEFTYRGHRVISMPPPSSGGLTIALIAGILDGVDLRGMGWHSPQAIHAMAAAEEFAFARRNRLLGDPDFTPTPRASFLSPDTARALRALIGARRGPPPAPVAPADTGRHTTHFSVVDAHGNAVAMTTTLNTGFGSGVTVTGAGFLLNNEMDDFTTKPGTVNAMGLRQWEANAIEPGKRMLSSMTPTIVLDAAGAPWLVTGASGGARIITGVVQLLSNVIDFRMPLGDAMAAPRFHAQDFPDSLWVERGGYDDALVRSLAGLGYKPVQARASADDYAFLQSIMRVKGRWHGVPEPRSHGLASGY